MITCDCGRLVLKKGLKRHLTTEAHMKALGAPKEESKETPKEPSEKDDDSGIEVYMEDEEDFGIEPENDDFLGEFRNDTFEQEKTKDELAEIKRESALLREKQKLEALKAKETNKLLKNKPKEEETDEIFSNQGSEIIGLERRMLIKKVQQYKFLFPKELKGFKIKKGASIEELNAYIQECEAIVSLDGTEKFVLDGLYHAIAVVEGVSAMTQDWDITGLHIMLKNNLQFQQLAKILFVKYGTFSKVAPEYQASFIVLTSAYICKVGNSQRKRMMKAQNQQ